MLRHQIVILRRKSPHPRLTAFDRIRLLVAVAVIAGMDFFAVEVATALGLIRYSGQAGRDLRR